MQSELQTSRAVWLLKSWVCFQALLPRNLLRNSCEVKDKVSATNALLILTLVTTVTQRKNTPLQLVTTETKGGKGTFFGNFCHRVQKRMDH